MEFRKQEIKNDKLNDFVLEEINWPMKDLLIQILEDEQTKD